MTDVPPPAAPDRHWSEPALSAEDLVRTTAGQLLRRSDRPIRGAAVDSRLVRPGQLFVALVGERTDGHRFLADAVAAGAAALIVSAEPDAALLASLGDVTVVRVPDGVAALGQVAADWRRRFSPLVVGVTGSIAKTSTKEAIAAVLGQRFETLKTEGNHNNEIGLPLTVLELGPEHDAAVLEMGMYVGGEIADLARIGMPRLGVVTAVQPVHLSRIGTIEAIERAKGELVEALPIDGAAILNADDERVRRMAGRTAARSITYGFAGDADVRAEDVQSTGFEGMRFVLRIRPGIGGRTEHGPTRRTLGIPALGRLAVHNALAAAAVGLAAGMTLDEIAAGLVAGWSAPRRTNLIQTRGVAIVDDTYNASPGSVAAALELLSGLPGRHIAVLGEMLELGAESDAGHRRVGETAAELVERLVVIGEGAQAIAEGALAAGLPANRLARVPDRDAALADLPETLEPGDVVLVKASRGIALDELVDDLVAALGRREAHT